MQGQHQKKRVRVLVKAFPQPSTKHEETVCCAGITEDGQDFLRLFPIRYRRLPEDQRFGRFDLVEMTISKAPDHRPESYHVDEESIQLIARDGLSDEAKVRLWLPFTAPSLAALLTDNKAAGRSLGIIKPNPLDIKFIIKEAKDSEKRDQNVAQMVYRQASLLEDPLRPLEKPRYSFSYHFTCVDPAGCSCINNPHKHQIHDWEVQAAYFNYKRRYKSENEALTKMKQEYQDNIPSRNLHFIMGTMKAHPQQFIIIGLLRSQVDPTELAKQKELF